MPEIDMDLATRLLAHLRTAIGEPRLELVEHPERVTGGFNTRIFGFRLESVATRRRRLDASRLVYYEAVACMKALTRIAESQLGRADGSRPPDALDTPSFTHALVDRVATITSITPALPV